MQMGNSSIARPGRRKRASGWLDLRERPALRNSGDANENKAMFERIPQMLTRRIEPRRDGI